MIKLIATDLDGTLCNANHCLDQTIAEYMKKLSARRIEWVLASGRAMSGDRLKWRAGLRPRGKADAALADEDPTGAGHAS